MSAGPFNAGVVLTADDLNKSFARSLSAPLDFEARISAPNFFQRLLWRALGVTWRDLRPERDMEALRRLE